MRHWIALFAVISTSALAWLPAAADDPQGRYQLVWSDEFDSDGPPDPRRWAFEEGFVRNRELQWYQKPNAYCENGLLVIEARRERRANPHYEAGSRNWKRSRSNAEFTSASLVTTGEHQWRFGRFEMRARIDTRPGLWPAFWTLGSAREWPGCGEIDIMEYYQGKLLANACWGTALRWVPRWDSEFRRVERFDDRDWADRFHVWRMDWSEESIQLFVDRELMNTIELSRTVNPDANRSNPFREPHRILLSLAVGGSQGGDPGATDFPARFEIDYVRVYQKRPAAAPPEKKATVQPADYGEPSGAERAALPGPNRPDEPCRDEFSAEAAVRFLDAVAVGWQKERKCFACHSDYAFFFTRPVVGWRVPAHTLLRSKLEHFAEHPGDGKHRVTEAVMTASMLAQNDALTTGRLHPTTRKALDRMWTMQRDDGGFDWMKYRQPPSEVDDHYGVTMAAIGVGAAPGGYAETPAARAGLERIRGYFKAHPAAHLHHRAMKLLASLSVPGVLTEAERQRVVDDLFALQKPDGGWAVVTLGKWERSDGREQDRKPSDGYGTGFAIYVLRRAGVPREDPRIQKGIEWLKTHQRASGRWFTRSMWRDRRHYITHAGTAYAILALAECGEMGPTEESVSP